MKRFSKTICMIFLCVLVGTLTVNADDRDVNSGSGITFTGDTEKETEKSSENVDKPNTDKPNTDKPNTDKPSTTDSSKPSLPQTGQESGLILQAAGVIMLILAGGWTVVKNRGKSTIFPERKRAG